MTRIEIIGLMMNAFTKEEISQAKAARDEWFREHPLDSAVAEAGSRLNRIEDALSVLEREQCADALQDAGH